VSRQHSARSAITLPSVWYGSPDWIFSGASSSQSAGSRASAVGSFFKRSDFFIPFCWLKLEKPPRKRRRQGPVPAQFSCIITFCWLKLRNPRKTPRSCFSLLLVEVFVFVFFVAHKNSVVSVPGSVQQPPPERRRVGILSRPSLAFCTFTPGGANEVRKVPRSAFQNCLERGWRSSFCFQKALDRREDDAVACKGYRVPQKWTPGVLRTA
jgi:hypothetical protein